MTFRRLFDRARDFSRSFVPSVCAVAVLSGVALAQQNAPQRFASRQNAPRQSATNVDDSSLDARLTTFLAERPAQNAPSASVRATVPTFAETLRASEIRVAEADSSSFEETNSGIRSVRAAYPVSKPEPIRQTQYAEAPVAALTSQLSRGFTDSDEPYVDACPDPRDMPSILDIPYKVVPKPGLFPENCPLPDEAYQRKAPTPIAFTWKASSLCYKPLYFEDVQLERYGHYCHPLLQPFASRARFWLTIPVLPYLMGVNPPNECVYDLGYYRPGNCAPSMLQPIPISLRGALLETGAIVGVAAIVP